MVSHDLRNPLEIALGRVAIERRDSESEHLGEAARALTRMDALITDPLDLARQGQPIDEEATVGLSSVASQCWQMLETGDADLSFVADQNRLQQLLENLFRNAIEHGGPDVTIYVGTLEEGCGFYVADDGPGIPQSERDAVLESGYTTTADGTGFGLAIVQEIVDAHGWNLDVTGSREGGARFEFTGLTERDQTPATA